MYANQSPVYPPTTTTSNVVDSATTAAFAPSNPTSQIHQPLLLVQSQSGSVFPSPNAVQQPNNHVVNIAPPNPGSYVQPAAYPPAAATTSSFPSSSSSSSSSSLYTNATPSSFRAPPSRNAPTFVKQTAGGASGTIKRLNVFASTRQQQKCRNCLDASVIILGERDTTKLWCDVYSLLETG